MAIPLEGDWFACPSCRRRCRVIYGGARFRCRLCYGAKYESEPDKIERARLALAKGIGIGKVAREVGLCVGTRPSA